MKEDISVKIVKTGKAKRILINVLPEKLIIKVPQEAQMKRVNEVVKIYWGKIERRLNYWKKILKKAKKLENTPRDLEEFKEVVRKILQEYSQELGVVYNKILFRRMKTRWASCSPKRNITINTLAKDLPERHLRYILYHELVHLIERKHSTRFWKKISEKFPDYREIEEDLLAYFVEELNKQRNKSVFPLSGIRDSSLEYLKAQTK